MKVRIGMLIVATALVGPVAQAGGGVYWELGFVPMRFSGGGGSLTPDVAMLRIGYDFTKNFGAEVMTGTTVRSDSGFKVNSALGVYLKGKAEVAKGLEVFAKLGAVRTQLSVSGIGSAHDNDFSYAAGAQYHFTKSVYGQVDYASYYNKGGLKATGPSLSIGVSF